MKNVLVTMLLFLVLNTTNSYAKFSNFQIEGQQMAELLKCKNAKISKTEGLPDLWSCIWPQAEVVKVFINGKEDNVSVENIKVMWNDWTKDVGYGVHTDKEKAEEWVKSIAEKYAPNQISKVLDVFRGSATKTIESEGYVITYTYEPGPSIDERLLIITAK